MNIPKGINWQESRKRFQVRITNHFGERKHVGRFKTLAEAKRQLEEARKWVDWGWL